MKITIYTSNTLNAACGAVIDSLGKNNAEGTSHIFIAPDKFSLSIEKEIFERLQLQASFNIDVVSFMRLAKKTLGATASECLSKEGALLVFKKILNSNADRLCHYGRVACMPSFASEMYAVVTSFRNNCISPEDIIAAADTLSKNTKKKALDIALLYKEYISELQNGYPDGTSRIDSFVAAAPRSELIKNSHIYIAGFSAFSAKQYQVITALMNTAKSVSIGATPYNGGANAGYYPSYTLERLQEIAYETLDATVEICPSFVNLQEPFGVINRSLFAVSDTVKADSGNKFVLVEENTVYEEINGIAKEIAFLTSRKGIRYKDIAVVCCNAGYAELIRNIFARYQVPCFVDKKYRLKDSLIFKHLAAALDSVEYGYRQDKVRAYIKNPLCGVPPHEADAFENYVLAACINYGGFLTPFRVVETDVCAETARAKLVVELSRFSSKKQTAGDFARACLSFIIRAGVSETLAAEAALTGDAMIQASNMQSADRLAVLLGEIETLIGKEEYSFGECKNILYACAEGVQLSLIPQYADSVFVGNIKDSRYDNLKVLFIMSATRDVLPASHDYQAIISAKDSVMMEEAGLRLYPTPQDEQREDMFALLDLFTKVEDRIYFGYSKLTPDGKQALPSPVFAELRDITGAAPVSLARRYSCVSAEDRETLAVCAASPENAYFEFLQLSASPNGAAATRNLDILYSSLPQASRDRITELMYADREERRIDGGAYFAVDAEGRLITKATQIEAYFMCPRLHHLQLGLKLKPRKDGKLEKTNAGIVIHRVLELFFKRTGKDIRTMSDGELDKAAQSVIEEVFSDAALVGESADIFTKYSLQSIKKECRRITLALAHKVKKSAYTPQFIEKSFGKDEIIIDTSEECFVMRGKIDRVDVSDDGKKAIVIDYKTGSKDDPVPKDVYFGKRFQLWIYLKALESLGYEPAGAFYLPITDSPKKDEIPYLLNGFFDTAELGNLDTDINGRLAGEERAYSDTVFIKINKKNKVTSKNALDKAAMQSYVEYNVGLAKLALDEILSGYADKSPMGGERCERCPYIAVCGGAEDEECRTDTGKISFAGGGEDEAGEADND